MDLEDPYVAYCFDEVCYYYKSKAIDDKGRYKWNLINWSDKKKGDNKDLIEFINKKNVSITK